MDTIDNLESCCHILVVDDEEAIRNSLSDYLNMVGYNASSADDAEKALEVLNQKHFDIVIADIRMPGMDGLELTDIIKKKFDCDVIIMTGFSGDYTYEDAISKGASDFVFKPVRFEELILRIRRVLKERNLAKDREKIIEELKHLSITDELTKLYNSRYFYEQLKIEIEKHTKFLQPLSLLLLDIDFFKNYNDVYGHVEGDKVLSYIGKKIKVCLRKWDTAYRYGGEEFTILLSGTNRNEAIIVAERIRSSISSEKMVPEQGKLVTISVSIGVTEYCPNEELSGFVKRADKAMYISKDKGRNRVTALFIDKAE
ncbi:MAG: diguanylate cyclase [Desulfobacterales bacterium]|nr:diguanylate cyclase [Desulfobacterales bacterium]